MPTVWLHPSLLHFDAVVHVAADISCPSLVFASVMVSVSLQRTHFAVFVPSAVQVASLFDTKVAKLWPRAEPTM